MGNEKLRLSDGLFMVAVLLMLGLAAKGHRVYSRMIRGIAQLHEEFPEADLSLCGFPENWEDVLKGV